MAKIFTEQEILWKNLASSFQDGIKDKACDWAFGYLPSWERGLGIDFENLSKNKNRTILDFGCGKGTPASYLKKLGVGNMYGVDTSSEMIAEASKQKEEGLHYYAVTNGSGLPFEENFF